MFLIMTASAVRSSSLGLNHKNSVPGSFVTGMWPGGMQKASPTSQSEPTLSLAARACSGRMGA